MTLDQILGSQSVIITLDIDSTLNEKLTQLKNAGLKVVELNCNDEGFLKEVMKNHPELKIGAGNIITTQQLEDVYQAGVHFATSPGFLPALAQTASIYSMNYLPGVATLSEAMQVMSLGYTQLRPYPAVLSFCSLLNRNLPSMKLYPAEIDWDQAEHYFNLPSVAAVSIINPESKALSALSAGLLV